MKTLKFQIKSQINQREFKICFSLLLLLSIGGFMLGAIQYYHREYMAVRSAADNFLLVSTSARAFTMIFTLFFPLVAAALCAGYRKKNERRGDGLFSMMRMGKRKYILGNAVATVGITVVSIFVILGINQLLCMIAFPINGFDNRFGMPQYMMKMEYDSRMLFEFWQIQNPYIYNLLYSIIISLLGGGIALLAYGLCFLRFTQKLKPIQLSVIVFAFFALMMFIGQVIDVSAISYLSYVETEHYISLSEYLIFVTILYVIGIALSLKGMKDYEYI